MECGATRLRRLVGAFIARTELAAGARPREAGTPIALLAMKRTRSHNWPLVQIICLLALSMPILAAQSKGYGPEVKSFLEYVRHEETELNFQIEHKEIGRRDYLRSKTRLEILRETVLSRVKRTGEDLVPEYHVVATDEVEELIPGGTEALKGVKPGDVVLTKWKYVGNSVRGEKFYILERIVEN